MTSELKDILAKTEEKWSDEEREIVNKSAQDFADEVSKVCENHGLAYKSVLQVTENGVLPILKIVVVEPKSEAVIETEIETNA